MRRKNGIVTALVTLWFGTLPCFITKAALIWGIDGTGGSGTWTTTSVNWWNGSNAVKWTEGEAIFAGSGGTINLSGTVPASQLTFAAPGYDLQGFLIQASAEGLTLNAQSDATVGATIFASGAFTSTLTKTGSALLTLTHSPAFFGTIVVAAGELRFAGSGSLNGTNSYTLADSPGVILSFSSSGEAVTNLNGGGTTGGIVRPVDLGGTKSLTIYGGGASFAGSLQDNGGTTLSLEKSSGAGAGTTQTLTGVNTYSGATLISGGTLAFAGNGSALNTSSITIRQDGQLLLDNSNTSLANRVSTTAPITSQGGTISLVGNLASDPIFGSLGPLTFSGSTQVSIEIGNSRDIRLTFAGLQRSNLGTIHFSGLGFAVNGATNTNGIVGAYATVGDDWATVTGSGSGASLRALTTYAYDINSASSTANVKLVSALLTANVTRNSLNLASMPDSSAILFMDSGATLTLSSGGILSSGPGSSAISGGKITSASSTNELIVTNSNSLRLQTVIADTTTGMALTKSGPGALTLDAVNTYTGATTINEGVLEVSRDSNLGSGTSIFLNGGTLRRADNSYRFDSSKKLISSPGMTSTIDTNGRDLLFTGASSGSFTKIGEGTLVLGNVSSGVSITVNAGSFKFFGPNPGTVTLNGSRLMPAGSLNALYSSGGAIIAPLPKVTFTINTLQLNDPTIFEFHIADYLPNFLTVTSEYRDFSGSVGALFRFLPTDTIDLGAPYDIMSFSGSSIPAASSFGLSPDLVAAGWEATFNVSSAPPLDPSGPHTLSVTFSAVPEPGTLFSLSLGIVFLALVQRRRQRSF